jgi:hypothetical protein
LALYSYDQAEPARDAANYGPAKYIMSIEIHDNPHAACRCRRDNRREDAL